MPRYFFDIHDSVELRDAKGLVLPDLTAARQQAARALTEVARDSLPYDGAAMEFNLTIRDETGAIALTTKLSFTSHPHF